MHYVTITIASYLWVLDLLLSICILNKESMHCIAFLHRGSNFIIFETSNKLIRNYSSQNVEIGANIHHIEELRLMYQVGQPVYELAITKVT